MPEARKKIILILVLTIFFAAGFIYILVLNLHLRRSISDLKKVKEIEFKEQLGRERESIQKDMSEKYSVDTASFEALAKRLEIENKRTKEIEAKVKKATQDRKK